MLRPISRKPRIVTSKSVFDSQTARASTPADRITALLQPFQKFGVNLGLTRIQTLLAALGSPHEQVPVIHVAGSNGKGSVCAYLTSVLSHAGYRVGRYTSPHLVHWTERICLGEGGKLQPIAWADLEAALAQTIAAVDPTQPKPTLFEIVTAAAWLYFAQQRVDVAVVEVGLGGRLDATNVCDRPLASIITAISKEHWQVLGETLTEIAGEKAGVLKPGCPAIIGPLPTEAQVVVAAKAKTLECPVTWVEPAKALSPQPSLPKSGEGEFARSTSDSPLPDMGLGVRAAQANGITYPLALAGPIQLTNSAIAIATLQSLRQQGWTISDAAITQGMATTRWPGRMEWQTWNGCKILTDGAHNPAAAMALRDYVDTLNAVQAGKPVTWVMGMLSTKEHEAVFRALLRPGDRLYTAPVPNHSSADPEELVAIAKQICPQLFDAKATKDVFDALKMATQLKIPVIFCGSLYLLGYFLEQHPPEQ